VPDLINEQPRLDEKIWEIYCYGVYLNHAIYAQVLPYTIIWLQSLYLSLILLSHYAINLKVIPWRRRLILHTFTCPHSLHYQKPVKYPLQSQPTHSSWALLCYFLPSGFALCSLDVSGHSRLKTFLFFFLLPYFSLFSPIFHFLLFPLLFFTYCSSFERHPVELHKSYMSIAERQITCRKEAEISFTCHVFVQLKLPHSKHYFKATY
jgi:hypothetical protein